MLIDHHKDMPLLTWVKMLAGVCPRIAEAEGRSNTSAELGRVRVVSVLSVDGDPLGGCVGSGMCVGRVSITSDSKKLITIGQIHIFIAEMLVVSRGNVSRGFEVQISNVVTGSGYTFSPLKLLYTARIKLRLIFSSKHVSYMLRRSFMSR